MTPSPAPSHPSPVAPLRSYDTLQPSMMFLKGNFLRRRLQLDDMVQDMLQEVWAFKSYGLPKVTTRTSVLLPQQ